MFKNKTVQFIFGIYILSFAITCILLDSFDVIDVEKFGYAFFGGIVLKFADYFYRKSPPND